MDELQNEKLEKFMNSVNMEVNEKISSIINRANSEKRQKIEKAEDDALLEAYGKIQKCVKDSEAEYKKLCFKTAAASHRTAETQRNAYRKYF